ncbi:MAG: hypothetical protein JSS50_03550 [Proteobacteria bacterium]|nr:hypothetical protein [Pseudomonadota bacterium]
MKVIAKIEENGLKVHTGKYAAENYIKWHTDKGIEKTLTWKRFGASVREIRKLFNI